MDNTANLLGSLRSQELQRDGGYIVRQSLRHGVAKEEIRLATIAQIKDVQISERSILENANLLFECDRCGIFTREDEEQLPLLATVGKMDLAGISNSPSWATLIEKKRTEFYRLEQQAADSPYRKD